MPRFLYLDENKIYLEFSLLAMTYYIRLLYPLQTSIRRNELYEAIVFKNGQQRASLFYLKKEKNSDM